MVEDKGGLVHLSQDQEHFIVYEFLEFFQVAAHLCLQFTPDLCSGEGKDKGFGTKRQLSTSRTAKSQLTLGLFSKKMFRGAPGGISRLSV